MKAAKVVALLAFGAVLTIATLVAIGFGDAFSGWGDGTTNDVRHHSTWSAWPTAAFGILTSVAPTLRKKGRLVLYLASNEVLFLGFWFALSGEDRIFLPVCVFVISLAVWLPLLMSTAPKGLTRR